MVEGMGRWLSKEEEQGQENAALVATAEPVHRKMHLVGIGNLSGILGCGIVNYPINSDAQPPSPEE